MADFSLSSKGGSSNEKPSTVAVETVPDSRPSVSFERTPDGILHIKISDGLSRRAAQAAGRIPAPELKTEK